MKTAVIVLDSAESNWLSNEEASLLQGQFRAHGFEVHWALGMDRGQQALDEWLPHMIVLMVTGPGSPLLGWLGDLRRSSFSKIPVVIFSPSTHPEVIQGCLKARVKDFVLVPIHFPTLAKKLVKLNRDLEKNAPYQWSANESQRSLGSETSFGVTAAIKAVSESGIQIEGPIGVHQALSDVTIRTTLFNEMGVSVPWLRFTNSGTSGPVTFARVYGWEESDRKILRNWVRSRKLEVLK